MDDLGGIPLVALADPGMIRPQPGSLPACTSPSASELDTELPTDVIQPSVSIGAS